jgi:alcohol dehydrogenase class IV
MRFDFATAGRILFGAGCAQDAVPAAAQLGCRALFVTGARGGRTAGLVRHFEAGKVKCIPFAVAGEPDVETVRQGVSVAREQECDLVISVGGGSAIDAGKAIAALIPNSGDPLDYLEVIGRGKPLENPSASFIAIPTTAGTGSEVTRNAVLASPEHGVKASLRSASMLPKLAVVDPELTSCLPPAVTASTGLDALTQLIEPYVSIRGNAMTDMLCVEGIRRAALALPRAWSNGSDREARAEMSWASLLGGMALANAGLGAVHGFAAPIGGMFPAPHGAVCAAVLPHAMDVNVRALKARAPESRALHRYGEIARLVTGNAAAGAEDGVAWVANLCRTLEIQPLRAYGVREQHASGLAAKAANASSMKGNPISLTADELKEIVLRAL